MLWMLEKNLRHSDRQISFRLRREISARTKKWHFVCLVCSGITRYLLCHPNININPSITTTIHPPFNHHDPTPPPEFTMAWPGEPFHDTRFRDILRDGAVATPTIERYIRILTQAQQERLPDMANNRWQMLAAATVLAGVDCFTITATGSGKSFCYQLVTMLDPVDIILVICPLVGLMDEQVTSAARLGIEAAAIHAEQLVRRPELLSEIQRGKYQIVFAGPEFCVPSDERWIKLTTDCAFRDNLRCVVVDEAHLCHAWRGFRPTIDGLWRMRAWFKVPYLVLSATMTPYVRSYVHHSLRLSGSTPIIHRPVDRPEIYLCTRIAQHPMDSHKDLDFLFQDGMVIEDIEPTIVFVDSRAEVCRLTQAFWDRAPAHWIKANPFVFADLSTALSPERRSLVIQAVRKGLVKILFATQIAEVGLDFGNIYRVVQWKVPLTLTASALWQRFGQACRRRGMRGVGILIVQPTLAIKAGSPLEVFLETPAPRNIRKIMTIIHQHDTGAKTTPSDDSPLPYAWAKGKQAAFEVNPVKETRRIQRKRRRLDMPSGSQALLMELFAESNSDDNSEDEDFDSTVNETSDSSDDERDTTDSSDGESSGHVRGRPQPPAQTRSPQAETFGRVLPDTADPPEDDNLDDTADGDGDSDLEASPKGKRLTSVCRMLLWVVNTPGCVRECMMRYLDEADFDNDHYAFPTPPDRPCCDRHTATDRLDADLAKLLPEFVFRPSNDRSPSPSSQSEPAERLPQPSYEQISAIQGQLRSLRRRIWAELGLVTQFSPYPSYQLLSDEAIKRLGQKSASILGGSLELTSILEIETDITAPDPLVRYFDDIKRAIQTGWDAAPPVPQKRRGRPPRAITPFVPPFDINPHADRVTPEVQLALSQIEEAREAHGMAGQASQRTVRTGQVGQAGEPKQTIRYADESALHPDVKRMIGKRPQGRPSKAKVEQRNQQIAAALTELGLAEEPL
jgi:superfamily II DNA/RNA helicase